jgi:hypothetical protein
MFLLNGWPLLVWFPIVQTVFDILGLALSQLEVAPR